MTGEEKCFLEVKTDKTHHEGKGTFQINYRSLLKIAIQGEENIFKAHSLQTSVRSIIKISHKCEEYGTADVRSALVRLNPKEILKDKYLLLMRLVLGH